MLKTIKKLSLPLILTVLTAGLAVSFSSNRAAANGDHNSDSIVGAWEVDADAPYRPHLFTFNADGTMFTTNPTNVQEDAGDPHGGTNDSVGMGTWRIQKDHDVKYVVGTFEQLNAFADDHTPTDKLSVSFKITVDNDAFDGPAVVKLGSFTVPSHISGNRILVDQTAVDSL